MTFEEVWQYTDRISSETAFSRAEGQRLFELAWDLVPRSVILEIGCEYGRSTSILAQVCKEKDHRLILIDPEPTPQVMETLLKFGPRSTFHMTTANEVARWDRYTRYDLLHIDGSHTLDDVLADCYNFATRTDGWVALHDYGRDSLPDVKEAADQFFRAELQSRWIDAGLVETLKVFKRK